MTECLLDDARLASYAEGTLPEADRAGVESHLKECARCRGQLEWLRTLAAETSRLPRARTPERDLWSGIAARLEPAGVLPLRRPRLIRFQPLALVAAAVALMIASAALTALWLHRGREQAPPSVTASNPGSLIIPAGTDPQARALAELVRQVRDLEQSLPAGTRALVAGNLALIDAAIAESEQALAGRPENPAIELMLQARYRQRLELLEQARRVAPES
jgi:hypothetical protein